MLDHQYPKAKASRKWANNISSRLTGEPYMSRLCWELGGKLREKCSLEMKLLTNNLGNLQIMLNQCPKSILNSGQFTSSLLQILKKKIKICNELNLTISSEFRALLTIIIEFNPNEFQLK